MGKKKGIVKTVIRSDCNGSIYYPALFFENENILVPIVLDGPTKTSKGTHIKIIEHIHTIYYLFGLLLFPQVHNIN